MLICLSLIETEEERKSFERLYSENKNRMYGIALKYLNNSTEAEDVVQEVFYRIVTKKTKLFDLPENKQSAYLNVMTKHIAIDNFKKNNKESIEYDDSIDTGNLISLEDEIIAGVEAEELIAFIKKMPLGMRESLYAKCIFNMSNSEAAEQFGISEAAFRQRLCSARREIRMYIERKNEYE